MEPVSLQEFKTIIWDYYRVFGRSFDWRNIDDPYKVFISEVMLQQTQTSRVAQKYPQFILEFPSFESLSAASLKAVLTQWQGLGYNRRGLYLHRAAQDIIQNFMGRLPNDPTQLEKLPGIGKATAASITAFAFNTPTIFIETNIRTVFIHFFFTDQKIVQDKEIIPLLEDSLDKENPREWYYALMDYGVMLKKSFKNPSRKSAHHIIQSKFEGSDRQIRGKILKLLTLSSASFTIQDIIDLINKDKGRVEKIVKQMAQEKIIVVQNQELYICESKDY